MLHNPYLDPIASILIGFLLGAVALVLASGSGALLLGESADPDQIRRVREIIGSEPAVEAVWRSADHVVGGGSSAAGGCHQVSFRVMSGPGLPMCWLGAGLL
jgi:divalent metal cation (Fe/Co/Zn/Cd) transporter